MSARDHGPIEELLAARALGGLEPEDDAALLAGMAQQKREVTAIANNPALSRRHHRLRTTGAGLLVVAPIRIFTRDIQPNGRRVWTCPTLRRGRPIVRSPGLTSR